MVQMEQVKVKSILCVMLFTRGSVGSGEAKSGIAYPLSKSGRRSWVKVGKSEIDVGDGGCSTSIIEPWGLWSVGTGEEDRLWRCSLRLSGTNAV